MPNLTIIPRITDGAGNPVAFDSAPQLVDPTNTFGMRRDDNDAILVAKNTLFPLVDGQYSMTVAIPYGVAVTYWLDIPVNGDHVVEERHYTAPISPDSNPFGTYWSWSGVRGVLGNSNAIEFSRLDSDGDPTAADFDRIMELGIEADSYTDFRATNGDRKYILPLPVSFGQMPLVKRAANLYLAFQMVRGRIWFGGEITDDERARAMLSLKKQYMDLYTELFGASTTGIDAPVDGTNPTGTAGTFQDVALRFSDSC